MSTEPSQWAKDVAQTILGPEAPYGTQMQVGDGPADFAQIIQEAIDAATAQKDQEIARLKAQLAQAVRDRSSALTALKEQGPRIAKMAALLDSVPHFHTAYNPEDRMDIGSHQCDRDCPACRWAKMKENK